MTKVMGFNAFVNVLGNIKSIPSVTMEINNSRFDYKRYQNLH